MVIIHMTDDFITRAKNDFYKKVNELRNAEIVFYDNQNLLGESEFLEFGYKHQDGNTVHTVADWGCIWKHFETILKGLEMGDTNKKELKGVKAARDTKTNPSLSCGQIK